jgi:hypothetical protein
MSTYVGVGILLLATLLILGFSFLRRKSSPPIFREVPAFTRLAQGLGISVEEGTRLHVSLGRGELLSQVGSASFAGLAMLRKLVERTSGSDKPLVVTSGDGVVSLLVQDTLQAGYRMAGAEDNYSSIQGRLTGLSPFTFAAGAIPVMSDENIAATVMFGHFGTEVALLTSMVDRTGTIAVAASDELAAQALLYASVDDPLVGEELFAAGAYVGAGKIHEASLQAQDVLRWIILLTLLGGALFKLFGSF